MQIPPIDKKTTKRLDYIDIARGICMLLIMAGHCANGTDVRHSSFFITWIYSFHTTTFFIITGILMEHIKEYKRPLKSTLTANVKRLMIPYFIFQSIYMCWYCLLNGLENFSWMILDIILLVDWSYSTWFLPVLFVSKTIVIIINKICNSTITSKLFSIVLFIGGIILINMNLDIPVPWIYRLLLRSLIGVGFINIGCIIYRYLEFLREKKILITALSLSLIFSYKNSLVSTFFMTIHNPVLYIAAAISGAIFVISISFYCDNRFLSFFGRESVLALGLHQIILRSIPFKNVFLWFVITPATAVIILFYKIIRKHVSYIKVAL